MMLRLAGRTIVVRDILNKVLDVVSVTKDVGASLTSLNPCASLAWGGVQFFVQAAVTHREVGGLCWDELPRMVRLISQYQTFEFLYETSQLKYTRSTLEDALVNLFSAILRYQVAIVKYASSRIDRFKNAFQDVTKSLPQQILDDVAKYEAQMSRLQAFADREINNMQFRRVSEMTATNSQQLEAVAKLLRDSLNTSESMQSNTSPHFNMVSKYIEDSQKLKILEWISTIKYGNAHNNEKNRALAGTGEWLIHNETYRKWRNSKNPSHLWLNGTMGSGKSCLTHLVINDMQSTIRNPNSAGLAYFYCVGGSSDNVHGSQILKCILRQLAVVNSKGTLSKHVVDAYEKKIMQGDLSNNDCVMLLEAVIDSRDITVIVLDGLDECEDKVQRDILTLILKLRDRNLGTMKMFLSSRPTEQIRNRLNDLGPLEISTFENNVDDLMQYIQSRVNEPGYESLYHDSGRSQEDAVENKIKSKAGGMFRWVELAFNFLHDSVHYDAMSRRLEQLSYLGELFDLYDKIYDDMMRRLDLSDQSRITALLMFKLHDETYEYYGDTARILDACEFSATGDLFGNSMKVARVRTLCPSLIVLAEGLRFGLAFPHVSVREWLLTGDRRSHQFSAKRGHCFLAQLCMDVICATGRELKENPSEAAQGPIMSRYGLDFTKLQYYSFRNWLRELQYVVAAVELEKAISPAWPEEKVLREGFENFLFNSNNKTKLTSPDVSVTGLQLWHEVGSRQSCSDHNLLSNYREEILPYDLFKYKNMPTNLVLPAFICAIVGHYFDLPNFQEAAMNAGISSDQWCTRSLAAVMVVCDIEASTWLVKQLQPSSEVLTDALLLTVSLELWQNLDFYRRATVQQITYFSQLINLLVARGLDVNNRHSLSKMPLLVSLIETWVRGKSRYKHMWCVAVMTACIIEAGADALVPVKLSDEVTDLHLEVLQIPVSKLVTLLDWVLLWNVSSVIEAVQPIFLAQEWNPSVWTTWLEIGVRVKPCSYDLIRSCLAYGANVLIKDSYGEIPLYTAIGEGCGGLILDILSVATFTADTGLRMDVFDPDGRLFIEIVKRCSRRTIEFWVDRGADVTNSYDYRNQLLRAAKRRTRTTGDSSVEEYVRSLGATTPPHSP